jgi:signal transduction histidine kinase
MQTAQRSATAANTGKVAAFVVLVAGVIASTMLLLAEYGAQRARTRVEFDRIATDCHTSVQRSLDASLGVLRAVAALFASSREVTEAEFRSFTTTMLRSHPETRAIDWMPRVAHEARASFEQEARTSGNRDFQIWDASVPARSHAAPPRDGYLPIRFTEPMASNHRALGLDLATQPKRFAAMQRACDSGEPTAVIGFRVQHLDVQPREATNTIAFAPLYGPGEPPADALARKAANTGFVSVFLQLDTLLLPTAKGVAGTGVELELIDATASPDSAADAAPTDDLQFARTLHLADAQITLAVRALPSFTSAANLRAGWLLFTMGLLATVFAFESVRLLARRLDQSRRHAIAIADETEQRREAEAALRSLNADLEHRIQERTADLQAKTKELEAFAYSVAHDLRAPLRAIDGYSRLLQLDHAATLGDEARQFVANVRAGALQMDQLIRDLLEYARLARRTAHLEPVDLRALVEHVTAGARDELRRRGGELVLDLQCPTTTADAEGLTQALRNYVDNSVKFTRDTAVPRVEVGSVATEHGCRIWVRDNGCGFDPAQQERIFEIFQRLHRDEEYPGTGIGLAIVRKAMQRMGGTAHAVGSPGNGATFYLETGEARQDPRP